MGFSLSIAVLARLVFVMQVQASEQFSVRGASLGMTPEQITDAFEGQGIFPDDGGVGRSFATEQQGGAGTTRARVEYTSPGATDDRPLQAESIEVVIFGSDDEEDRRIYADLVERNGEPTRCSRGYFCTWTARLDGWKETLTLTPAMSTAISLRAEGTDSDSFRQLAAAGSTAAPPVSDGEVPPHDDFGPLTPIDVTVGTPMKEATRALEARGFAGRSRTGNPCAFEQSEGTRGASVRFTTAGPGGYNDCEELGVIYTVSFNYRNARGLQHSTDQIVAYVSEMVGSGGDCSVSAVRHRCVWESPPGIPLARSATMTIAPGSFAYSASGFPDLLSRVEMPKAPVVSLDEQPWWKQELARVEGEGLSRDYSAEDQFQELSEEDRQRLEGEAGTVYEYCRGRSIVNSLHDCNCVAQAFVVERMKPQEPVDMNCRDGDTQCMAIEQGMNESRIRDRDAEKTIIKMADDVVEQCPDKAGAANYAHERCRGTYRSRLQDESELEAFCQCYAEAFAARYVENPRPHTAALTAYATSAIGACR